MRRRSWWRVAVPLLIAGVGAAIVIASGHELNVGYLLAATLVVSALLWLAMDLVPAVPYTSWQVTATYTPRQPGTDMRLARFTERLTSGVDRDLVAVDVQRVLTEVVDERLRRLHGIDRAQDPATAAAVLGPELTTYLTTTPHLNRTGQAEQLSRLLTRIEDL